MAVINLTKENFKKSVLENPLPVLVDFYAPWCGPCRMVSPIVDELSEELEGRYAVGKINVDEEGEIAAQFGVSSIPTLMLFRNGKQDGVSVGAIGKDDILDFIGA